MKRGLIEKNQWVNDRKENKIFMNSFWSLTKNHHSWFSIEKKMSLSINGFSCWSKTETLEKWVFLVDQNTRPLKFFISHTDSLLFSMKEFEPIKMVILRAIQTEIGWQENEGIEKLFFLSIKNHESWFLISLFRFASRMSINRRSLSATQNLFI